MNKRIPYIHTFNARSLNLIHMRFQKLECLTQEDILSQYQIPNWTFYIKSFILWMYVSHIIACSDIHIITENYSSWSALHTHTHTIYVQSHIYHHSLHGIYGTREHFWLYHIWCLITSTYIFIPYMMYVA